MPCPFQEIDAYIMQASDKGYSAVISLGSKGISYATNVVLNTAIKVGTKCINKSLLLPFSV